MDLKKLFGIKKKEKLDVSVLRGEMDGLMLKMGKKMLSADLIEAGSQAVRSRLKDEGFEFNSHNLKVMKMGMELMIGAGEDANVKVPLLLVQMQLIDVEEKLEEITK